MKAMLNCKLVNHNCMKLSILGLCFLIMSVQRSYAQQTKENPSAAEQEIINLSREKWRWMAEKKADTLAALFHEKYVRPYGRKLGEGTGT